MVTRVDELIVICTCIIFTCSVQHTAVTLPMYDEYAFPPNYPAFMNGDPPEDRVSINGITIFFTKTRGQFGSHQCFLDDNDQTLYASIVICGSDLYNTLGPYNTGITGFMSCGPHSIIHRSGTHIPGYKM